MNRNTIGLIWIGGLVLAVLLTVIGPGMLGTTVAGALDRSFDTVSQALAQLGDPLREMIRGFAIAAYVVFIVLCVLARRRGLPSMTAAIVVTLLFLLLAGEPRDWGRSLHGSHWLLALLLTVGGALLMTRRLMVNTASGGWSRRSRN